MAAASRSGSAPTIRDSHLSKSRAIVSTAGGTSMIQRLLLACAALLLAALAQLQVLQFDGTIEAPVGALVDVGSASVGDTLVTRFHVLNIGAGPAIFQTLSLAGSGFSISVAPSLPYTLAPGAA